MSAPGGSYRIAYTQAGAAEMLSMSLTAFQEAIKTFPVIGRKPNSRARYGHDELVAWFNALPVAERAPL